MNKIFNPALLALSILYIPTKALCNSNDQYNQAENVIIYGMKDLELELDKKNPRLEYLISRLNQVEAAIGIYGEDGYQLKKGKHAFRYKSIRENAEALISQLEKEESLPKNFGESVQRELVNGCMDISKRILVNDICGAKVDPSKRYDNILGTLIVLNDRLEREHIYSFLMSLDPKLSNSYEGMDPRAMRESFEAQRDEYLKNLVAKKPKTSSNPRGMGDLKGYDLLNQMEGDFADQFEGFIYECVGTVTKAENAYKQNLIDAISNDPADACGNRYKKEEISHLNSRGAVEKQVTESLERLKVLEPLGEYEDVAHERVFSNTNINKIQDNLEAEAKKEMGERIFY